MSAADCTYCTWRPLSDGTSANIRICFMFLPTRIIGLDFAGMIYLRSNFSGGLRKFCLFLHKWRFGRSRPFKVIDVGTNRKRMWFLLVCNSNLVLSCTVSEILQVLCAPDPATPHLFHHNFWGVTFAPDRPCWGQPIAEALSYSAVNYFQSIRTSLITVRYLTG